MSNKKYGLQKEREVKKILMKEGAIEVVRARGSFGIYDIIAFYPHFVKLISVKSTKQRYYSYNTEILKLKEQTIPAYCYAELWIWYSPNKKRKDDKKGWLKINIK